MLWWKAIHILAVISWMAGLLYLYRLFIYHNVETEKVVKERFQLMERRLMNIITFPAAILTLISGLAMVWIDPSLGAQRWFQIKMILVVLMLGTLHAAFKIRKKLIVQDHPYKDGVLRFLNEVPTLLMIAIVLLVVLKP